MNKGMCSGHLVDLQSCEVGQEKYLNSSPQLNFNYVHKIDVYPIAFLNILESHTFLYQTPTCSSL